MPAPHTTWAIILNYFSEEDTIRLYRQLAGYLTTAQGGRVIVADNSCDPTSKATLQDHIPEGDLHFNEANLGYAGGNNAVLRLALTAGAEYVWILNPDVEAPEAVYDILSRTLHKDSAIGVAGPRILDYGERNRIYSDGGIIFPDRYFHGRHKNQDGLVEDHPPLASFEDISYVNGSCMFIRAAALRKVGLLREDFFLYYEETDWCLRAKAAGWKVVVNPAAAIYHQPSKKGGRYHFYMTRNRLWMNWLHQRNHFQRAVFHLLRTELLGVLYRLVRYKKKPSHYYFSIWRGCMAAVLGKPRGV